MTSPPGQPGPDDRPEQDPAELAEGIRTGRIPVVPGSLVDLVMRAGVSAPETGPRPAGPEAPGPDAAPDRADEGLFSPGGRPGPEGPGTAEPLPVADDLPAGEPGSDAATPGHPLLSDAVPGDPPSGAADDLVSPNDMPARQEPGAAA
ncbi:hypothetical protein I4I78_27305, partial [Pseudonocardia sp. KRD-291]|nr:hypothetical protein [Pseudonocardia sp. KRD291]